MSRFAFALATPDDDAQLRARMAADWMEGDIAVSFRREPSYFAGCSLQGSLAQVIKCTELSSGRIVGMGARLKTMAFVNGAACQIGYLSDLRGAPEYRRGTLLARGYRFLQALHEVDPLPFYYSIIFAGNDAATRNLVGARAGLPDYTDSGVILTPALHLDLPKRVLQVPGVEFSRGSDPQGDDIVTFLNQQMARRQLAPCYAVADFLAGGRLRNLSFSNFFIARRGPKIVAALAAWDQVGIRQTHIERYSPGLRALRPLYNGLSALTPLKPLPAPGNRVPYLYFSCVAVAEDDCALFAGLLRHAYRALRTGPWHYAIIGLHERDPLLEVLDGYRAIAAAGRLYVVRYPQAATEIMALNARVPYVDMALA